ncbi:ribosome maturation factor RimM [Senegalia massiliensis]|uniref:ribosome maturation factor RimM n=1 Tax=Senegalia massiliensis TaxID=1720316 RepID=UPI0010304DA1|nr:ribosome maturation factor RimM [Senegalia massiliensis]
MKNIKVGKIINTHGIRGELKVLPLTDDPKRFSDLKEIYIDDDSYYIQKVGYKKNFPIIKLKEYSNINDVLKFKEKYIYISEENLVDLEEDSYFIFQIKGLKVFTLEGLEVGIVKDVLTPGANDLYVVKSENKNKEYLIPAVKEFIKEIDLENKKIIINPIEGLLE